MLEAIFKSKFNNTFQSLPKILFELVEPTPIDEPRLVALSEDCLQTIGLDLRVEDLDPQALMHWLNGTTRLEGEQRLASRYAGHQFGVWAGQLGDGRALSLGEWDAANGDHWEIQTKGSGLTPFSRMGDGKAVIRSSLREFLCSEAMAGLGIPTTRALALMIGSDPVRREEIERSAIVARVFPTNLRFGHFEYLFHYKQHEALKELCAYLHRMFFKEVESFPEVLDAIVIRTADLIAGWQCVGFCHGVMNTDNMSVLGLTIDYGPFGFLEDTDLAHVCNHSDHQGRYAFNAQPRIGMWNLERFLSTMTPLVPVERLRESLLKYPERFETSWIDGMRRKIGCFEKRDGDRELVQDLHQALHAASADFSSFFRALSRRRRGDGSSGGSGDASLLQSWLAKYDERLQMEKLPEAERHRRMLQTNPKYVLRNYIAQELIEAVEAGNFKPVKDWLEVLRKPYDEHPAFERYAHPPPAHCKGLSVSCSS